MTLFYQQARRQFVTCLLGMSLALGSGAFAVQESPEEPIYPPTKSEREAGFLFRQGVELIEADEFVRAEKLLRDALRLEPERLEIRPYLAAALAEKGDWQGALGQLDAYLAVEPTDGRVELMRVRALSRLGRLAEAEDSWARLGYEGLGAAWEWHNLGGYLAESRGDLEVAADRYGEAVRLSGSEVESKVNLVTVYLKLGKISEADELMGELLQEAPDNQQVLTAFALLLSERRPGFDPTLLRERLKEQTLAFELQYNLAVALLGRGELGEAGVLAGDLLDRYPDHPLGHWLYGRLLLERGDLQEARTYLEGSHPRLPISYEVLETLGYLEFESERFVEAADWYLKAAEYSPENPWPLHLRAVALSRSDRLSDSVAASKRAIELDPGEARFVYQLALALDRAGQREDAVREFQKFLELSEDENLKASVREHLTEMRPELLSR